MAQSSAAVEMPISLQCACDADGKREAFEGGGHGTAGSGGRQDYLSGIAGPPWHRKAGLATMAVPSAEALATATALANLIAAVVTANEGRKKAKEGSGALSAMEQHTTHTVSVITGSIDNLSHTVESVEKSISKEFGMFNDRFETAQNQLTVVLKALVRDRQRETKDEE